MRPVLNYEGVHSPRRSSRILDFGLHREEPVPKRRRVENTPARKRSLKECLDIQIVPHINRLVQDLPADIYKVSEIAVQTITNLVGSAKFRTRLDETDGHFLPGDEAVIAGWTEQEVQALMILPEFQRKSPPQPYSQPLLPLLRPRGTARATYEPLARHSNPQSSPEPLPATQYARTTRARTRNAELGRTYATPVVEESIEDTDVPLPLPLSLSKRPYQTTIDRHHIAQGARQYVRARGGLAQPTIYHIDFTADEIGQISKIVSAPSSNVSSLESLAQRCRECDVPSIVGTSLKDRTEVDIRNFCFDLLAGKIASPDLARKLSLCPESDGPSSEDRRASSVSAWLLARETEGNRGFGRMRRYVNLQNEFRKAGEDNMQLVAEYTNCAGDITTGSWVSGNTLICGTTAHSDAHNQQYNKPGNLLLCSTAQGVLRAYPDHRIPRPRVEKGENSTDAMRQSQDPWLYTSVVSSDYDDAHGLVFTSSFDKMVKVWRVDPTGKTMDVLATWRHAGNVNFVAAAKDGSGRVASAADSPTGAVRVYSVNHGNPSESPYHAFSCSRADAADAEDIWAYYPATLQWGKAPGTEHLLLVGYSPRSLSGDDQDIPEDKRNTGEVVLWDAIRNRQIPVLAASTANVFEVTWHPTLPRFIFATTPLGSNADRRVRTQLHIFQGDKDHPEGAYGHLQSLDCFAADVNELTIMPNSLSHTYVTAGCTDGKVYVWDTAQGDKPIHVLKHGYPLEEFHGDREREDTGVKFTAWGTTPDRFYSGSSDGVIKVWNVRNRRKPLVRNLLEAPGPISFGAFSPGLGKLAIGDATGRLFILSVDETDMHESHFMALPGTSRRIRRPKPFTPHPEPPPPFEDLFQGDEQSIGDYARRTYLDTALLVRTGDPTMGVVQGPNYARTGLFRLEAHEDNDPTLHLRASYGSYQKGESRGTRRRSLRRLKTPLAPDERLVALHKDNDNQDLNVNTLPARDVEELAKLGALLSIDENWDLAYEEMPSELSSED